MRLLVTGGAGYIGSVVAAQLAAAGHDLVVLDDLSTGHADAVSPGAAFVRGDIKDQAAAALADGVDAVLHFAGKSLVGESVSQPSRYWGTNLGGTLALIDAMRAAGVHRIVFSSTAAVYGEPATVPIPETALTLPTSPYGASKLAVDMALAEHARMNHLGAVSLRYFNVAGAHTDPHTGGWLGERHVTETHLIPNVLKVARARQGHVSIFGEDYPTPDGTCVRDYIHVTDLAEAHMLALEACTPGQHEIYNLGSGTGYSNRDVLTTCREVTGFEIPAKMTDRRPGDPAVLVASSERIGTDLAWHPKRDLHTMITDAWHCLSAQR